ncbi:MAG: histidine kinase dimerization/phospho-acceptor domain-containing protein, partial [Syntrophomonas sp.]|nr:histidine kinase dimerization/phospho-acceptor domain-containing protein [Syntrophomonas sp.]
TYQLEQTILKADKLAIVGQLAIGSLVEIRNPLTIARGFCQFIEENSEIEPEYIEIILNELRQIQDIVANCMSMVDNSQYSNLELLYKKIWACVGSQIDSYKLIMITDDFDNLTINIAEEHVNTIIVGLMQLLNIWLEENTHILISVELLEEAKYLNLNIRADCDVKWDIYEPGNLETIIRCLEGKNNQMELQIINNNTIMVKLHLPIIVPQYSVPKSKSEMSKVLVSK